MARVFEVVIPAEPGPEVTHVRDRDLDVWKHQGDRWELGGAVISWTEVVKKYGPLTDVSPRPMARTWTLPDEPGPEVLAVRDVDGEIWYRAGGRWSLNPGAPIPGHESWSFILGFSPLTDATGEVWS